MTDEEFDQRHAELLCDLQEVVRFLRWLGEEHWAHWMERDRRRIAAYDAYGLDDLLRAYGGMGSFNDIYIDPGNGHPIDLAQSDELNGHLRALRSRIAKAASDLREALSH